MTCWPKLEGVVVDDGHVKRVEDDDDGDDVRLGDGKMGVLTDAAGVLGQPGGSGQAASESVWRCGDPRLGQGGDLQILSAGRRWS